MDTDASVSISKVLAPVANPSTAEALLRLAAAFLDDDGKVIALVVLLGDLEEENETLTALEPLVQQLREEGHSVELQTYKATSVARGILDAVGEYNPELIVLGLRKHARGDTVLGTIAENVLAAAPCDVIVYRPVKNGQVKRVVVAVNGSHATRVSSYLGQCLAEYYDADLEAMYVQSDGQSEQEAMGKIDYSLEGVSTSRQIQRTLINARDAAQGILARLDHEDLLIVGYGRRSDLQRRLFGDFSRQILNRAPGPVVLTAHRITDSRSTLRRMFSRFMLRLTPAEQDDMLRQAYHLSASNMDYFVLIGISAMLASLGLLLNSAAIIIGAMLVAPFMQPCIAYSIGIASGRYRLAGRALVALGVGILVGMGVAFVCGLLVPTSLPTQQILARGNPVLLDAWVALASGAVGAYATARKEIPTALAGVAIAAALMPPLAAFGLELAARQVTLGLHAGLLFLTNIVCISLAAWGVFAWLGIRPHFESEAEHRYYWPFVVITIVMLFLVVLLLAVTKKANRTDTVQTSLESIFPDARIVDVQLEDKNDSTLLVYMTLSSEDPITPADIQAAEEKLSDQVGERVKIRAAVQQVVTSPEQD